MQNLTRIPPQIQNKTKHDPYFCTLLIRTKPPAPRQNPRCKPTRACIAMQAAKWQSSLTYVSNPNPNPPYKTQRFPLATSHHYTPLTTLPTMAKLFLSVLSFLLLFSFTFAVRGGGSWQQGECQISRINAQQPSYRIQAEGGLSEFWDHTNDEFQCAGVSIHRHRLQSKSLMLPAYHNAPLLAYVLRGRGMYGILVSGCPETCESSQSQQQQYQEGERIHRLGDRHQKIHQFRQGDIIAIPAGAAHWFYNEADEEFDVIVLQDLSNNANQLDQNPRSFFLAGSQQQQEQGQQGQRRRRHEFGNVFRGFDTLMLAEVFNVDEETARKIRGENDQRGHIIRVEGGLGVIRPPFRGEEFGRRREEEEQQYGGGGRANGIEETICTAKTRQNIDNPARADVYNPRAGRFTAINSFTLPVLSFLQLSAARGVLHRNAIMSPHWFVNAHSIIYVTRGDGRMQIVDHMGQAVFDGRVNEGQVVVVPQNFAVVKQAGEQGFEWVEFNTNDNAMINTLSGRTSALRGLPAAVIANSYQISTEQAQRLKYSREETLIFSGSGGRVATA